MDMDKMIKSLKGHPDYPKMGMIASHLGVVRGTSLNGGSVEAVDVVFDDEATDKIINETRKMPGIVEVLVETCAGRLKVGDEIMAVVVGGDTRDHVFPALISAVDSMKLKAAKKRELFKHGG